MHNMQCSQPINYTIRRGDTLWRLAQRFQTTVPMLFAMNPGIDAYNLQIGSTIIICPNESFIPVVPPIGTVPPEPPVGPKPPIGVIPPKPPIGTLPPKPPIGTLPPEPPVRPRPPIGVVPPKPPSPSCPCARPTPPIDPQRRPSGLPPCNTGVLPGHPHICNHIDLIVKMRQVWSQHVYWTRLLMLSIVHKIDDEKFTTERLLKNPVDFAKLYDNYYPDDVQKEIADIVTEHLKIGGKLMHAVAHGTPSETAMLTEQWYQHADKWACSFNKINPFYNYNILKDMLTFHLDLTSKSLKERVNHDYTADIATFDRIENEAMSMADFFAAGLISQFLK